MLPANKSCTRLQISQAFIAQAAFLAKFSKSSCRMTNEKFSMTNFQFRLSALAATCRVASLGRCASALRIAGQTQNEQEKHEAKTSAPEIFSP
jgi:hypothetical protein